MVLNFTIKVTGVDQIIFANQDTLSRLPMTKRQINQDLSDRFVRGAKDRIHHVTHKTEGSTKAIEISEQKAVIESRFGAFYEERRRGTKFGTPHNFLTQQLNAMDPQIINIVNNRLTPIFSF